MTGEPGLGPVPLQVAVLTDVGKRRKNNEDACGQTTSTDGARLFVVADGMGGLSVGEEASLAAVQGVIRKWATAPLYGMPIQMRLKQMVQIAHHSVIARGQQLRLRDPLGTTLVMLAIHERKATVAHVGDSRAYLLRPGRRMERLTTDHTEAQELVSRGMIDQASADHHRLSHILTRCLGPAGLAEPSIIDPFEVQADDTFIVCSDGLTGVLNDAFIEQVLFYYPPAEATQVLIRSANQMGGPDNITVEIVRVGPREGALAERPDTWRPPYEWAALKRRRRLLIALAVIIVGAAGVAAWMWYAGHLSS